VHAALWPAAAEPGVVDAALDEGGYRARCQAQADNGRPRHLGGVGEGCPGDGDTGGKDSGEQQVHVPSRA
jgi:hypothetical protein